jgi:predicted nucleic acid-binding protein
MTKLLVDTSVAIRLLVATHREHRRTVRWRAGRELALCGHALAETYSVLTRLPGSTRVAPGDVPRLLAAQFSAPASLDARTQADLPRLLADGRVAGGAAYDALVALAARRAKATLATCDARALPTYEALGVDVEIVS